MVTFHPSARLVRDETLHPYFKPQVSIRNARGQMVGCKTGSDQYVTAAGALERAREAAEWAAEHQRRHGYAATVAA